MHIVWIKRIFDFLISCLLPASPETEFLEKLTPAEFAASAARPLEDPPQGIVSLFSYKDPLVRKALWTLKYKGNARIAKLFARLLADALTETLADEELFHNTRSPLIVPVPLSHKRLKERGWNQTKMVAQELARLCPACTFSPHVLLKTKHTQPQTKLNRRERQKNLKGCFAAIQDEVRGRDVVLIDDVTTTGSTLHEAAQALTRAGARRVLAFTIAH